MRIAKHFDVDHLSSSTTLLFMGKASRRKKIDPAKRKAFRPQIPFVDRPYEGLVRESELVAMREIIPAATMTAHTNAEYGESEITFVTLLPDGAGAMVRGDGVILIGLQTRFQSGDLSHDAGTAIAAALAMKDSGEEGVPQFDVRDPGPRLQDVLVNEDSEPHLELVDNFSYWFDPEEEIDEDTRAALEQNKDDIVATQVISGVDNMYWCSMNNDFVRYVVDVDEDSLYTALARLQVAGEASFGPNSKFVGAFRACGIGIPVFQIEQGMAVSDLEEPAKKLQDALNAALDNDAPLSADERRVRSGMVSRQVTIR